jgi:hypothetical protein
VRRGSRDQVGQEGMRHLHQPERIRGVRGQMLLEWDGEKRATVHDAGIVDEDVDRTALSVDRVAHEEDGAGVPHVEAKGVHLPAGRPERFGSLDQTRLVEVGE